MRPVKTEAGQRSNLQNPASDAVISRNNLTRCLPVFTPAESAGFSIFRVGRLNPMMAGRAMAGARVTNREKRAARQLVSTPMQETDGESIVRQTRERSGGYHRLDTTPLQISARLEEVQTLGVAIRSSTAESR